MEINPLKPTLASRIEARLFSEGIPLSREKLKKMLGVSSEELKAGLGVLRDRYLGSGISLIETELEVALAISGACSKEVEESRAAELGRDVGSAGLEVLSIVLYRGPSTRTEIDYVRGVNSASTVRNLLERGLIERTHNPKDAREYLYRPTTDVLAHLGVTEASGLPEYVTMVAELREFEKTNTPDHGAQPE